MDISFSPLSHDVAREAAHKLVSAHQVAVYAAVLDALVDSGRKRLRILDDAEVERRTSLPRKLRLKLETAGKFPLRVPLTERTTGYVEGEIERWIEDRLEQREEALKKRRSPNPLAKSNRQSVAQSGRHNNAAKD